MEAILDGRQPAALQLEDLLKGFPLEWEGQKGSSNSCRSFLYDRTRLLADGIGAASGSPPRVLYIQR